ncbi:MAG: AraC family transcriptional regulator [Anaerocolumna sp.]
MIPFYETSDNALRTFYTNDFSFPSHLHNSLEFLYVMGGTIRVTIHNRTKILGEGDFAVIFPNVIHSYDSPAPLAGPPNSRILIGICGLNLTGDFLNKVSRYYPVNPFISSDRLHENIVYAMQQLELERRSGQNLSVCAALVQLILSRTIPAIDLVKNNNIQSYDLTEKIITFVSNNFQESLTLTNLAEHMNVSKYHLSRVFSSKLGTSFNKYLNYIRLNYAVTLIQSTEYSLTQISNDSGFDSQRTFNRAFREVFYMSPSEYRQNIDHIKF